MNNNKFDNEKVTLYNLEAEQAVIGAMLDNSRYVGDIIAILRSHDFYSRENKYLCDTIFSMFSFAEPINQDTVLKKMQDDDILTDKAKKYVLNLINLKANSTNIMGYAGIIKDKASQRTSQSGTIDDVCKDSLKNNEHTPLDVIGLLMYTSDIIKDCKIEVAENTNRDVIYMFWELGKYLNKAFSSGKRARVKSSFLTELSAKLTAGYGNSFCIENLYKMMRFSKIFPNYDIVFSIGKRLTWSHICELIKIESNDERAFYAFNAAELNQSVQEMRSEIEEDIYNRDKNSELYFSEAPRIPIYTFDDPFLLDVLGLKKV